MQDNIYETSAFSVQATSLKMLAAEYNHRVVAAVKIMVRERFVATNWNYKLLSWRPVCQITRQVFNSGHRIQAVLARGKSERFRRSHRGGFE